ncbi:YncE family protein [Gemmatimonas sp.]|uniref:YncE family protein n=1 Tax=Gemmatimonas sp. TaxID=1962908 RepID=UPI0035613B54
MPLVPSPRKSRRAVAAAPVLAGVAIATALALRPASLAGQAKPAAAPTVPAAPLHDYWVYVGAESADNIYRVRFGPQGTVVEKTIGVGELAAEMEGPHGLVISQDGKYLHMTTGHGFPDGKYWRYELGPDTLVGPGLLLGNFPASIDVTPDGLYALSVNFNLHGDMIPSTVSVIYTPTHTEVARIVTCTMPHGSRVSPDGMRQYSTCMMDDQLVEVDTKDFVVSRRFSLAKGKEGPLALNAPSMMAAGIAGMLGMDHAAAGHDMSSMGAAAPVKKPAAAPTIDPAQVGRVGMGIEKHTMAPASCSPTWAQPSANGASIYVACNKADEILEIDTKSWALTRRIKTGRGVYNLAVTANGRLMVATLKQGNAIEIYDLSTGVSVAQLPTSTRLAHGVTISSDSRYAFVSSEGQGAQPGKVDVIDLVARAKVGTADVGPQASGIAFWKITK